MSLPGLGYKILQLLCIYIYLPPSLISTSIGSNLPYFEPLYAEAHVPRNGSLLLVT